MKYGTYDDLRLPADGLASVLFLFTDPGAMVKVDVKFEPKASGARDSQQLLPLPFTVHCIRYD